MTKKSKPTAEKPRCGLCGKTKKLTKTECCGHWICDDEDQYALFSYERNSCHRNHRRYTLCGYHYDEGHDGEWQTCTKCRNELESEMVAWYGTNEYNFEIMPDPPSYEPTKCSRCGVIIKLTTDGYTMTGDEYWCAKCAVENVKNRLR